MESIEVKKSLSQRKPDKPAFRWTGAHDWNRTSDLVLTKEVLYRLSYMSELLEVEFNGAGDGNRTRTISLEG